MQCTGDIRTGSSLIPQRLSSVPGYVYLGEWIGLIGWKESTCTQLCPHTVHSLSVNTAGSLGQVECDGAM